MTFTYFDTDKVIDVVDCSVEDTLFRKKGYHIDKVYIDFTELCNIDTHISKPLSDDIVYTVGEKVSLRLLSGENSSEAFKDIMENTSLNQFIEDPVVTRDIKEYVGIFYHLLDKLVRTYLPNSFNITNKTEEELGNYDVLLSGYQLYYISGFKRLSSGRSSVALLELSVVRRGVINASRN